MTNVVRFSTGLSSDSRYPACRKKADSSSAHRSFPASQYSRATAENRRPSCRGEAQIDYVHGEAASVAAGMPSSAAVVGCAATKPARVLIVDDEPLSIDVLEETLREHYQISRAGDGEQAIRTCELVHPDLILLDVSMPGLDGYEVCRRLKSSPST